MGPLQNYSQKVSIAYLVRMDRTSRWSCGVSPAAGSPWFGPAMSHVRRLLKPDPAEVDEAALDSPVTSLRGDGDS